MLVTRKRSSCFVAAADALDRQHGDDPGERSTTSSSWFAHSLLTSPVCAARPKRSPSAW
jgi:hypothetical protein